MAPSSVRLQRVEIGIEHRQQLIKHRPNLGGWFPAPAVPVIWASSAAVGVPHESLLQLLSQHSACDHERQEFLEGVF